MKISPVKSQTRLTFANFFITVPLVFFSSVHPREQSISDQAQKMDSIQAVQAEKIATFKAAYPDVKVEIDSITGGPEELWGDLSKNQTKSDLVEAAYEFFEQNIDLYGITNLQEEIRLSWYSMDQNYRITAFRQLYKGVQIYKSLINVYFDDTGKLKGVKGGFFPRINISTTPSITSNMATTLVQRDLGLPVDVKTARGPFVTSRVRLPARLTVLPSNGKYVLTWADTEWDASNTSRWEYLIDAKSSKIIHKEVNMRVTNKKLRLH